MVVMFKARLLEKALAAQGATSSDLVGDVKRRIDTRDAALTQQKSSRERRVRAAEAVDRVMVERDEAELALAKAEGGDPSIPDFAAKIASAKEHLARCTGTLATREEAEREAVSVLAVASKDADDAERDLAEPTKFLDIAEENLRNEHATAEAARPTEPSEDLIVRAFEPGLKAEVVAFLRAEPLFAGHAPKGWFRVDHTAATALIAALEASRADLLAYKAKVDTVLPEAIHARDLADTLVSSLRPLDEKAALERARYLIDELRGLLKEEVLEKYFLRKSMRKDYLKEVQRLLKLADTDTRLTAKRTELKEVEKQLAPYANKTDIKVSIIGFFTRYPEYKHLQPRTKVRVEHTPSAQLYDAMEKVVASLQRAATQEFVESNLKRIKDYQERLGVRRDAKQALEEGRERAKTLEKTLRAKLRTTEAMRLGQSGVFDRLASLESELALVEDSIKQDTTKLDAVAARLLESEDQVSALQGELESLDELDPEEKPLPTPRPRFTVETELVTAQERLSLALAEHRDLEASLAARDREHERLLEALRNFAVLADAVASQEATLQAHVTAIEALGSEATSDLKTQVRLWFEAQPLLLDLWPARKVRQDNVESAAIEKAIEAAKKRLADLRRDAPTLVAAVRVRAEQARKAVEYKDAVFAKEALKLRIDAFLRDRDNLQGQFLDRNFFRKYLRAEHQSSKGLVTALKKAKEAAEAAKETWRVALIDEYLTHATPFASKDEVKADAVKFFKDHGDKLGFSQPRGRWYQGREKHAPIRDVHESLKRLSGELAALGTLSERCDEFLAKLTERKDLKLRIVACEKVAAQHASELSSAHSAVQRYLAELQGELGALKKQRAELSEQIRAGCQEMERLNAERRKKQEELEEVRERIDAETSNDAEAQETERSGGELELLHQQEATLVSELAELDDAVDRALQASLRLDAEEEALDPQELELVEKIAYVAVQCKELSAATEEVERAFEAYRSLKALCFYFSAFQEVQRALEFVVWLIQGRRRDVDAMGQVTVAFFFEVGVRAGFELGIVELAASAKVTLGLSGTLAILDSREFMFAFRFSVYLTAETKARVQSNAEIESLAERLTYGKLPLPKVLGEASVRARCNLFDRQWCKVYDDADHWRSSVAHQIARRVTFLRSFSFGRDEMLVDVPEEEGSGDWVSASLVSLSEHIGLSGPALELVQREVQRIKSGKFPRDMQFRRRLGGEISAQASIVGISVGGSLGQGCADFDVHLQHSLVRGDADNRLVNRGSLHEEVTYFRNPKQSEDTAGVSTLKYRSDASDDSSGDDGLSWLKPSTVEYTAAVYHRVDDHELGRSMEFLELHQRNLSSWNKGQFTLQMTRSSAPESLKSSDLVLVARLLDRAVSSDVASDAKRVAFPKILEDGMMDVVPTGGKKRTLRADQSKKELKATLRARLDLLASKGEADAIATLLAELDARGRKTLLGPRSPAVENSEFELAVATIAPGCTVEKLTERVAKVIGKSSSFYVRLGLQERAACNAEGAIVWHKEFVPQVYRGVHMGRFEWNQQWDIDVAPFLAITLGAGVEIVHEAAEFEVLGLDGFAYLGAFYRGCVGTAGEARWNAYFRLHREELLELCAHASDPARGPFHELLADAKNERRKGAARALGTRCWTLASRAGPSPFADPRDELVGPLLRAAQEPQPKGRPKVSTWKTWLDGLVASDWAQRGDLLAWKATALERGAELQARGVAGADERTFVAFGTALEPIVADYDAAVQEVSLATQAPKSELRALSLPEPAVAADHRAALLAELQQHMEKRAALLTRVSEAIFAAGSERAMLEGQPREAAEALVRVLQAPAALPDPSVLTSEIALVRKKAPDAAPTAAADPQIAAVLGALKNAQTTPGSITVPSGDLSEGTERTLLSAAFLRLSALTSLRQVVVAWRRANARLDGATGGTSTGLVAPTPVDLVAVYEDTIVLSPWEKAHATLAVGPGAALRMATRLSSTVAFCKGHGKVMQVRAGVPFAAIVPTLSAKLAELVRDGEAAMASLVPEVRRLTTMTWGSEDLDGTLATEPQRRREDFVRVANALLAQSATRQRAVGEVESVVATFLELTPFASTLGREQPASARVSAMARALTLATNFVEEETTIPTGAIWRAKSNEDNYLFQIRSGATKTLDGVVERFAKALGALRTEAADEVRDVRQGLGAVTFSDRRTEDAALHLEQLGGLIRKIQRRLGQRLAIVETIVAGVDTWLEGKNPESSSRSPSIFANLLIPAMVEATRLQLGWSLLELRSGALRRATLAHDLRVGLDGGRVEALWGITAVRTGKRAATELDPYIDGVANIFENRLEAPLARERARLGLAVLQFRTQLARRLWRERLGALDRHRTLVAADVASAFEAHDEELKELLRTYVATLADDAVLVPACHGIKLQRLPGDALPTDTAGTVSDKIKAQVDSVGESDAVAKVAVAGLDFYLGRRAKRDLLAEQVLTRFEMRTAERIQREQQSAEVAGESVL
ncbi:MAG: hypothetical protein WCI05_03305 [Myxococcales bacterium]